MTYIAFVGLITALIALFMGLLVFLVEKKSTINTLVQVSFLSVFALGVTVFFAGGKGQNIQTITNLWKFGYLGILFTPAIVVHIIHLILGLYPIVAKNLLTALYGTSTLFGIALFFGFVIQDVSFTPWGYYDPNADILGYAFIVFLFLALGYGSILCLRYYKDISSTQRNQILGLFLALVFGGFGALFFYLPDFGVTEYQWGTIFLVGYPALMGYAILRYQFFDISDAFLRVFRLLGSILLGIILFGGFLFIVFGREVLHEMINLKSVLLYGLGGVLWFIIYKSKYAHNFANSKEKQILSKIVDTFLCDTRPHDTVEDLESTLKRYFHDFLEDNTLVLYDRVRLSKHPGLLGYFKIHTTPLKKGDTLYRSYAHGIDGEILFPIYSQHQHVIGVFLMGKKRGGKLYSQEDLDLLSQILLKLSLSLQVLSHNLDLRVEVLKRTYELTEKNKELEKAYEELKEIDKNKDNFLAIASHELRTPMTIIKGYADMLIAGTFGSLSEEQKKYMLQIYNSTEELINFVNNILDISKLEAGRMVFTYKSLNHRSLIKKIVENFMTLCAQKSISLTLTDTCERSIIETDETKLILILNNLLSNAYKFTNTNGRIEVKMGDVIGNEKEFLQIEVTDTGIGMTEETQKHIFEKYNQSQNQEYTKKSIEGSGLGLHLTQEVITHMGGTIQAHSQINVGTMITAIIPYNQTL